MLWRHHGGMGAWEYSFVFQKNNAVVSVTQTDTHMRPYSQTEQYISEPIP